MTILLLLAACAITAALTGAVRHYALRRDLLDIPNQRSSHAAPTPRGGGVAVVLVCLAAAALLAGQGVLSPQTAWALLGGGLLVALVGLLDDLGDVRARWRLLAHLAAAAWLLWWLWPMAPLPLLPGLVLPWNGLLAVIALIGIAWLINLYNFMDGTDALAATQAITVAAPATMLLSLAGAPGLALFTALVAAAALGFLAWNLPPARIFMGDAGSGFLGFIFAGQALASHAAGAVPIWSWLILLGVFIVDATVTLLRRMARGERWYQAHRSHAYQHAARAHGHGRVALAVAAINLLWLLPLAAVAAALPTWGVPILLAAWAPLTLLALHHRAGT